MRWKETKGPETREGLKMSSASSSHGGPIKSSWGINMLSRVGRSPLSFHQELVWSEFSFSSMAHTAYERRKDGWVLLQTTLLLRSNCTPTTLQLRSNYSPTVFQLCSNYTPTTLQLCSNYIPITLQLRSNYVPTILQLRSNYTPIILQLRSNYTPTTLQLGSNYTPTTIRLHSATFQLFSNYPPSSLKGSPAHLLSHFMSLFYD